MHMDAPYNRESSAYDENQESRSTIRVAPAYITLPKETSSFYSFVKRLFDIVLALIFIPLLSPLLLLVCLLIRVSSPGEAIFKQTRVGQYGKPFQIYKFRTMTVNAPPEMATQKFIDADQYVTRVGKILRRTSLDELPQLINILMGDMSLIGPRPLVPCEKEIHKLRLARNIYSLKPGITGLAQINGRDLVKPEEKVDLDERYLKSFSLHTDVKIFFKTIYVVLSRKGILDGCQRKKEPEINSLDAYRSHVEKL